MTEPLEYEGLDLNKFELLIDPKSIEKKIAEVSKLIDQEYKEKELVILMIMKGAICLVSDLIRHLHLPFSIEFIQCKSYFGKERGKLQIFGLDTIDLTNKDVLAVDDIYDSGTTLDTVITEVRKKNPKSLKTLVLLSKKTKRVVAFDPEYVLFEIEDRFVIGYGLDYNEQFRGLSGVYAVRENL